MSPTSKANQPVGSRLAPQIPGLFFDPSIEIPANLADDLWSQCMQMFFRDQNVNQIMLFERARSTMELDITANDDKRRSVDCDCSCSPISPRNSSSSGLPAFLIDLLGVLEILLRDFLPPSKHALLFPGRKNQTHARQVILNHYRPGEGITPHVDLLGRYGDGIIGVSLHSGCVMRFAKVYPDGEAEPQNVPSPSMGIDTAADEARFTHYQACTDEGGIDRIVNGRNFHGHGPSQTHRAVTELAESRDIPPEIEDVQHLYLPARSVLVLTEDARYKWTHGIEKFTEDLIQCEDGDFSVLVPRDERLSITFRWLLPGADIVGGDEE